MNRRSLNVARGAALLALGALAVHQLRYLIAFGADSSRALHDKGHGYLADALPILVALAVAALVAGLVVGAMQRGRARPARSALGAGLTYAAALFAVFSAQELAEGAVAAGHPAGLAALLADGGWVALPLSLALGLGVAVAERLLQRSEDAIATAIARFEPPQPTAEPLAARTGARRPPLAARALAFGFARRPPPPLAAG